MEERTLRDLLAEAAIHPAQVDARLTNRVPVRSLAVDSRAVQPGACFLAVRGTSADGHAFVADAVQAGAASVVVERDVEVPPHVTRVRVPDTREAAARLAAAFYRIGQVRKGRRLRLIGITGTNGKSTTACILRSILEAGGHRGALLGTIQYDLIETVIPASLTTPGPVELCSHLARAAAAGATYAVLEVSSHALSQRRCDGLEFDVAVFTNLSGDHLDYHRDLDSYLAAKKRLFDGLSPDVCAVVNGEDPMADALTGDCRARVSRFGLEPAGVDVWGRIRRSDRQGSVFDVTSRMGTVREVRIRLLGRHNVMNALAAAGAGLALGVRPEAIRRGIAAVESVSGRLQRVGPDDSPFMVLVDYAHTDHALESALRAVRPITDGRLICVFGCGGDRDQTKRPRMGRVVSEWADVAVVTSDNPRSEDPQAIIREILPGFGATPRCQVEVEPDRAAAIDRAIGWAAAGDTVLIAGKGHEDYQEIAGRRVHFNDAEVAMRCFGSLVEASA